jgi:hypothetical protein
MDWKMGAGFDSWQQDAKTMRESGGAVEAGWAVRGNAKRAESSKWRIIGVRGRR